MAVLTAAPSRFIASIEQPEVIVKIQTHLELLELWFAAIGGGFGCKGSEPEPNCGSQRFPWVKKVYWRNEFWSEGFFSSTVGIDEAVIQRYVEFQEKADKGQLKLQLDSGFGSPVPRA